MFLTAIALISAAPACTHYDVRLPRSLAGWTRNGARFDTGHATTLGARGGRATTSVRIRRAGIFGIALDQAGWIEIARPGSKPLTSAQHGHGPQCSTIRKIVRYKLGPGTYRVTVSRLRADRARMMLIAY